ncbi:unnamed protein product [Mytilus coruscus]|uniref:Uncharacterized protein n=1 Tax=Mytilus coruscus TaxID=42192 RepID=A0A6J8E750_MYTCO|nr:unnamed protein product [Mytilus coruscus]
MLGRNRTINNFFKEVYRLWIKEKHGRSGRKKKINPRDDRKLQRLLRSDRRQTLDEITDAFNVIRARTLIEENAAVGSYDPKHIPDHSLLCWTFVTPGYDVQQTVSDHLTDNGTVRSVKYDTRSIPNDWSSVNETISKLNTFITELEESEINQLNLDNKYEDFVKIVHTEMDLS